ncbi:unnamed protein product [Trifolium pratense]|uniref:Uncharacterized protein n=1 Tax=Trifolium pratense TaxID=57577 RepID=A0ACB0KKN6_TRIPR|nr:unnamed protein product [Trifolium pratense]
MNRVKIEPENLIYLSSDDEGPIVKGRGNGRMQSKGEASQGMNGRMQGSSPPVQGRNGRMQSKGEASQGMNGRMQGSSPPVQGRNGRMQGSSPPVQGRNGRMQSNRTPVQGRSAAAEANAHNCEWVTPVSRAIQNLKKKQTLHLPAWVVQDRLQGLSGIRLRSHTNRRIYNSTILNPGRGPFQRYIGSGCHHTTTQGWNDQEDSKDCDSTASTPVKPKAKEKKKQYPATETKAANKKICHNLGSTSAPSRLKDIKEWTALLEARQYKKINKILFCQPEEEDDNDFHINYHPSTPMGYEFFDTGVPIPEWMPVTFRPSPKMNLNDICAYTIAYAFMGDDEQKHGGEVLIKSTSGVHGDRKAIKSLMPRCNVDQEVINLVVARSNWLVESLGKMKSVWYLPTYFAVNTATRMKLALYLCHSSNNMLLQSLLANAAKYWDDMHKKRKALVDI